MLAFPFDECRDNRTIVRLQLWKLNIGKVFLCLFLLFLFFEKRFDLLVEQMARKEGMTEQLKAQEQMLWLRRRNNIHARAEEIVREEIIYTL